MLKAKATTSDPQWNYPNRLPNHFQVDFLIIFHYDTGHYDEFFSFPRSAGECSRDGLRPEGY